jgi:hypothetical protein
MRRKAGSLFVAQWPKTKPPMKTAVPDGVEEIEGPHCADADEVKQRLFHSQISEWLM